MKFFAWRRFRKTIALVSEELGCKYNYTAFGKDKVQGFQPVLAVVVPIWLEKTTVSQNEPKMFQISQKRLKSHQKHSPDIAKWFGTDICRFDAKNPKKSFFTLRTVSLRIYAQIEGFSRIFSVYWVLQNRSTSSRHSSTTMISFHMIERAFERPYIALLIARLTGVTSTLKKLFCCHKVGS